MGDGKVIWPLILEKAFAKMQGNYSHIASGSAYHGVRYMRGAPYESKETQYMTPEEIFDFVSTSTSAGHNVTASGPSGAGGDDKTDAWGIV